MSTLELWGGWLLLLLLLLDLLLALLHLFHDLLRCAGHWAVRETGAGLHRLYLGLLWLWRLRLLDDLLLLFVVFLIAGLVVARLRLSSAVLAGAQDDLARRSRRHVADHQDVVTGALQQLGEDIAGVSRAIGAEDALVSAEAVHLDAGDGGNVFENLLQAGVGRADAEAMTVPNH